MRIRNVLTTLALAVIVACGGGVDPEVRNFAVATAIEPSTAHIGDSIVITVTETNVSSCQRRLKMGHRHRVKMGQVLGAEP